MSNSFSKHFENRGRFQTALTNKNEATFAVTRRRVFLQIVSKIEPEFQQIGNMPIHVFKMATTPGFQNLKILPNARDANT